MAGKHLYDRTYEHNLVQLLGEYEVEPSDLVQHLLGWMSADDSCRALEDYCRDCEIDYEEEVKRYER